MKSSGCWGSGRELQRRHQSRGWMAGIGGCPNVGGICIACTMPGFSGQIQVPFMDEPPGGSFSSVASGVYGRIIRNLRRITNHSVNKEPKWRHPGEQLTTGYRPTTYHGRAN